MIDENNASHPANDDGKDFQPAPTFAEIAPAVEFFCWVVVALAPFLCWVNGAAVTDDQFYVQCGLATLAVSGAVGLRLYSRFCGAPHRVRLAKREE